MTLAMGANILNDVKPSMTRDQYEAFVIPLAPAMMRAATRLAYPDVSLAEDLVQAAMLRGYQMMLDGRFEGTPGSLSWFIRGITCDFLAHRRKDNRSEIMSPDSLLFEQIEESATPESILVEQTLSEHVSLALDQLPPDQRACIELVDLAECSYQDAARMLKVPVGTVRSRLSRARLFLCEQLSNPRHSNHRSQND
jgi:RNA polymerase sigma-70 factor, ECF subfamily